MLTWMANAICVRNATIYIYIYIFPILITLLFRIYADVLYPFLCVYLDCTCSFSCLFFPFLTFLPAGPTGQYADKKGSILCSKCPSGTFVDKRGSKMLSDCVECSTDEFSMPGAHGCTSKPTCTYDDIRTTTDPVSTCKKGGSSAGDNGWTSRKTSSELDVLAGNEKEKTCAVSRDAAGMLLITALLVDGEIPCQCDPGKQLTATGGGTSCTPCPFGQFQNGSMATCESCVNGNISMPGKFITDFSQHAIKSSADTTGLTGAEACPKGLKFGRDEYRLCTSIVSDEEGLKGWSSNANVATPGRTLGDVEAVLVWDELDALPGSKVFINCSINCNTTSGQAASSDACRLEIKLLNSTGGTSKELQYNCGEQGDGYWSRTFGRLGRPVPKTLTIPESADGSAQKWTFVASFIQRMADQPRFDAYEAKIFEIALSHTASGGAKLCERCPKGQFLSGKSNTAQCKPCGKGKQVHDLGQSCVSCPANHFNSLEEGRCHPCGNNTVATNDKIGCRPGPLGECKFKGKSSRLYDLNGFSSGGSEPLDAGTERGVAYVETYIHVYIHMYITTSHRYFRMCSVKIGMNHAPTVSCQLPFCLC